MSITDYTASIEKMKAARAARVEAGNKIAILLQAAHDRAAAEQRSRDERERERLRDLLGLTDAAKPQPAISAAQEPKRRRRPLTFRERDVRRAIAGNRKAGLSVSRTEISPNGNIVVVAGQPENVSVSPALDNEWD